MLPVLITIDTEYSSSLYARGLATHSRANFDRTIACRSPRGDAGICYQMDIFDRFGLTAVFFVDPIPALVWGQEAIDAIVQPILARGHEVQLHLHSEWLEFAQDNPLGERTAGNIKDLQQADQQTLLEMGVQILQRAGAPRPIAFRAGNYGANDDTLRALAALDIAYDSSFPPGLVQSACAIDLPRDLCRSVRHCGITEVPIAAIAGAGEARRHGQITALSAWEMTDAIAHAAHEGWPHFVLVSHSFELFNRVKLIPNQIVMRRFEKLCEWLARANNVETATFAGLHAQDALTPQTEAMGAMPLLPHNPLRTMHRMAEQLIGNRLYG